MISHYSYQYLPTNILLYFRFYNAISASECLSYVSGAISLKVFFILGQMWMEGLSLLRYWSPLIIPSSFSKGSSFLFSFNLFMYS